MSEDRIQRQMEFIIEQQAKFSTDIAALDKRLDRIAAITEKHSEHIGNLTDALLSLTHIVEEQGKQIKETNERFKETDARLKETDERLNTLIDIVERDIADRSEGESEGENED